MFRSFQRLSRRSKTVNKTKNQVRLHVEGLESRLVMSAASLIADFNHDGYGDLATAGTDVNDSKTGEVRILYGTKYGFDSAGQRVLNVGQRGNEFGFSLAAGDLNGDGYVDLAVGAPGENNGAGVVYVYYGSKFGQNRGLTGPVVFSQDSRTVLDEAEAGDRFGEALAIGNFNGDRNPYTGLAIDDLAVGVPGEDVQQPLPLYGTIRIKDAGAVNVLYGSTIGLGAIGSAVTPSQFWTENSSGIADSVDEGDRFGSALAVGNFNGDWNTKTRMAIDDLAIGVPNEDYGTFLLPSRSWVNAGRVHVVYGTDSGLNGSGSTNLRQPKPDVFGPTLDWHMGTGENFGKSLAAGNFNGDRNSKTGLAIDDLVVGIDDGFNPYSPERIQIHYGTISKAFQSSHSYYQDSNLGLGHLGYHFATPGVGDFDGDGFDDLAFGAPQKTIDSKGSAGMVFVVYGSRTKFTTDSRKTFVYQSLPGVEDQVEKSDNYGFGLAVGDTNGDGLADLAVRVKDGQLDDAVNLLFGSRFNGITPTRDQIYYKLNEEPVFKTNVAAAQVNAASTTGSLFGLPLPFFRQGYYQTKPNQPGVVSAWDAAPRIRWSDADGAARYELWVNDLTTGASKVVHRTDLIGNTFYPPSDLPNHNYRAWVRAFNASGQVSDWSEPYDFTMDSFLTPKVLGPADSTATQPTITWRYAEGSVKYDLWVDNLTTGQRQVIRHTQNGMSYKHTESHLNAGTYRVWVRGINKTGETTEWSDALDFRILAPARPELTGLSEKYTDQTPTFTFKATNGSISYELWVDNNSTGQTKVLHRTGLTTNVFTPASPLAYGRYTAWVRTFNAAGDVSPWSQAKSFTIAEVFAPSIQGMGAATSDTTPQLSWSEARGAVRYELWVDNLTTGRSKVLHQTDLSTNVFTPEKHLATGKYRVWVRAFSASGKASSWSKAANFRIKAPAIPEFTSPGTTSDLSWTPVANAVRYELWVNNPSTGENRVIHRTDLNDNTISLSNQLIFGEYRAWVRAFNDAGDASSWSKEFTFFVPINFDTIIAL